MKLKPLLTCLECLSFLLWIVFTIFSIALAGLGIEGIVLAAFMLIASSTQPVHFPLTLVSAGGIGVFLSILWRQIGVDHFHYLLYDSPAFFEDDGEMPSSVLKNLIGEVENSAGYARNDARAKAKAWLISQVSSLDEEDILLAKAHFGYLLPAEWGLSPNLQQPLSRKSPLR
jgi:hypothetical protein